MGHNVFPTCAVLVLNERVGWRSVAIHGSFTVGVHGVWTWQIPWTAHAQHLTARTAVWGFLCDLTSCAHMGLDLVRPRFRRRARLPGLAAMLPTA